ncbi:MAG: M16 family metallopeptidase [Hyphomicrobiaceae bacterium]
MYALKAVSRIRSGWHVNIATLLLAVAAYLFVLQPNPANAMKIETVKSPGGIEAWLVRSSSVPLLSMRFAFDGGSSQDPKGREGVANFLTAMMDEGAGDLDAGAFQERQETLAMRMSYDDGRDHFYGNFSTLTKNRAESVKLLKLAITKPRFDETAIERMRKQLLSSLVSAARSPNKVVAKAWYKAAFGDHVYGRPSSGTLETIKAITRQDLLDYHRRIFAKSNLKVAVVGDIDADALGKLLDDVFGDLPETAELSEVPKISVPTGGAQKVIEMNVPQSVAMFGLGAMSRKDPDFMPGFVLNHIVGSGGFSSKLMEEVREKRGLAYSVYTYINPLAKSSILIGSVATKNEAMGKSLEVIRAELQKMADKGPSDKDLQDAKQYLIGSYALRFDTSNKIANQMLGVMIEDIGIDYFEKRNSLIEAVTVEDLKRVAKTLLDTNNLIVLVVGKPDGVKNSG